MADIDISNVNPIPLTAVVTSVGGNYVVTLEYNVPPPTATTSISDTFTTMPSSVGVNVTSSTVPAGYVLEARGDGSWGTGTSTGVSGTFTIVGQDPNAFDFTIVVTDGSRPLARIDPRLIVKKAGSL